MLKMKGLLLFFNYLKKTRTQIYRRFLELSAQYCVDFLCNCGMFLSVEFIVFTCGDYAVVFIVLPAVVVVPEAGGGRVAGVSLCLMAHCIVWGACNVL